MSRRRAHVLLAVAVLSYAGASMAAPPAPPVAADPAIAWHAREPMSGATFDNIWVMNYDAQRKTRLLTADSAANGYQRPGLDATGAAIAASRASGGSRRDIWAWDISKNTANSSVVPTAVNRRLLAREASCQIDPTLELCQGEYDSPAWSPDGMHVAVTLNPSLSSGPGRGFVRVWTWTNASRTTGAYATLYAPAGQEQVSSPTWSPDGTRVAFVRLNAWSGAPYFIEACVVDFPGPSEGWTTCTPVPTDAGSSCHDLSGVRVRWNPMSQAPALARELQPGDHSVDQIVLQDEAGCTEPLDGSPVFTHLSWTPDGRALVLDSQVVGKRGSTWRLYQLCIDGPDPVNGPNRRLVLHSSSSPSYEVDRRRNDPDGTPNICDNPAFPEG